MPATSDVIDQRIPCDCGDGFWRYPLLSSKGLAVTKRRCPGCDEQKWIVVRHGELVGVTDVLGLDTGSFRDALKRIEGLGEPEVRALVASADWCANGRAS